MITPAQREMIKNCSIIYEPRGQAGEYAPLACNPYKGCGHGCAYCYVPLVTKQPRKEFDLGAEPRPMFLERLTKDAAKHQRAGVTEQVMLCFTTDPYHPGETSLTRDTLIVLRDHGLGFCTLTKGGTRALRDLDLFRRDRDAFACTLTTLDPDFSMRWERGAALPELRIKALKRFHAAGIFTWVSLEPTLDVEASLQIIRETHEHVDLYKIGRANYLKEITRTTDWRGYTEEIVELCARLGVKHYIKRDLQPFLPPGYLNPMRIRQSHAAPPTSAPIDLSSRSPDL